VKADDLDVSAGALRRLFELHKNIPAGTRESWSFDEEVAAFDASEAWLPYTNRAVGGPPDAGLTMVIAFCESAPDDDMLCWVGVALLEPLLDLHALKILLRFEIEARKRPALRKAMSCCWLHVKSRKERKRLSVLLGPDDDIGRKAT
jgi:hypothetical protein